MDINKLFKSGMRACGRVLNVLPQDEIGSPLLYMKDVLRDELLPSLNILIPRFLTKTFPIYVLNKVADGDTSISGGNGVVMDNRYNAFRIPKDLVDGADVIGIKDCFLAYGGSGADCETYRGLGVGQLRGGVFGRASSADLYARSLTNTLTYADAQLLGTMTPTLRSKFYEPNVLWLNKPYADEENTFITVTFKLSNDENLITVPNRSFEGVRKLFILDLKKSIYNEYGPFSEIETPDGPINLKIDDWSGAEADREQAYQDFLASAHFRNSSMRS